MSNNVVNRIKFDGDLNQIHDMFSRFVSEENTPNASLDFGNDKPSFDFNKIIQLPKELNECPLFGEGLAVAAYLSAINPDNPGFKTKDFPKISESEYDKLATAIKACMIIHYNFRMLYDEIAYFADINNCFSIDLLKTGEFFVNNFRKYGAVNEYYWCKKNWGTKWNSYGVIIKRDKSEIWFQTANTTPEPIVAKISSMYPDVKISVSFADESTGSNCGKYSYEHGKRLHFEKLTFSESSKEFANNLWEEY